jgi:acyl carrier protein
MRAEVFKVVRQAVEDLNEELDYDTLRKVTDDTPIFGGEHGIDSLSLVTLVVGLERDVETTFGKKVVLADEKAMSMVNSPYRSVGALVDYIVQRLEA